MEEPMDTAFAAMSREATDVDVAKKREREEKQEFVSGPLTTKKMSLGKSEDFEECFSGSLLVESENTSVVADEKPATRATFKVALPPDVIKSISATAQIGEEAVTKKPVSGKKTLGRRSESKLKSKLKQENIAPAKFKMSMMTRTFTPEWSNMLVREDLLNRVERAIMVDQDFGAWTVQALEDNRLLPTSLCDVGEEMIIDFTEMADSLLNTINNRVSRVNVSEVLPITTVESSVAHTPTPPPPLETHDWTTAGDGRTSKKNNFTGGDVSRKIKEDFGEFELLDNYSYDESYRLMNEK